MATVETTRVSGARIAVLAVAVGVVDALVFLGFEWLVKHGTDSLWNDLGGSEDARWRVIVFPSLYAGVAVSLFGLMGAAGAIAGRAALKRARSTGAAPS